MSRNRGGGLEIEDGQESSITRPGMEGCAGSFQLPYVSALVLPGSYCGGGKWIRSNISFPLMTKAFIKVRMCDKLAELKQVLPDQNNDNGLRVSGNRCAGLATGGRRTISWQPASWPRIHSHEIPR